MYYIVFSDSARKDLNKFDNKTKERILSKIKQCRIRPHRYLKRIVNSPYFRLRAGKYRIIIRIDEGQLKILVVEIGHRKNIYK